jgi:transposase
MGRAKEALWCSEADKEALEAMARSQKGERRLVERAKIILGLVAGKSQVAVARERQIYPAAVKKWRDRFSESGIAGLSDAARSGKPITVGLGLQKRITKCLELAPPKGQAEWDGIGLAKALGIKKSTVYNALDQGAIQLQRMRSWCVSTDKEFAAKSADVIGLYLNPPEKAIVFCVDEKPSIQALSRKTGFVETSSGKIVRGLQSTYRRNGTLNLFAALEVAAGKVKTKTTTHKKRVDFQAFMDDLMQDIPTDQEVHVILDNYCTHKKNDTWLAKHPNVTFHFTPTSASWLNMVEIWFGILTRKALRGASFNSTSALSQAITDFCETYNENAKPFVWKKREVKGSQLKNTVANLLE